MAMERLEAEITESSAHLAAAECRWLLMIAEFDRRDGAACWGALSTAHWLNWRCGLALGAGRERVRVGRRLSELPAITTAFATGQLSYSKVRALTRVATPADEARFVELALAMTAEHLERLLRAYRKATSDGEVPDPREAQRDRRLGWYWDDDGYLVVRGRLPPEDGATVLAALAQAADTLRADGKHDPDEGQSPWDGWAAAQADALVAMAETVLAGGLHPGRGGSRHQVVIHVDADTLTQNPSNTDTGENDRGADRPRPAPGADRSRDRVADRPARAPGGRCHLQDGPALSAETVRRLACDAGIIWMLDGPDGAPVNASRRTPTIPAAIARALKIRDQGCRFPHCTHQRFVDNHHIAHRADGGETTLVNLLQLCRYHHKLVHEGGYRVEHQPDGSLLFYRPDRQPLAPLTTTVVVPGDDHIRAANHTSGIHPTPETTVPSWDGERVDYGYIVDILLNTIPA